VEDQELGLAGAESAAGGAPSESFARDVAERPSEAPSPAYSPTGRPDVDAVLDRLGELDGLPPSEHADTYEDAHRRLHEILVAAGEGHEDPPGTS
jgi:hypothetical protein